MSIKVVIDYGLDKWRNKLDYLNISLEEIKNTYKMFHTKDIGTKHLDYNIRLAFKTKFNDQLAHLAGMEKYCFNCKTMANREVKETFLHGCYSCPYVNILINSISHQFDMGYNLKAKEVLLYKFYPDRKNSCVEINKSQAYRCIWMLFYSYILRCRSSYVTLKKIALMRHIAEAIPPKSQ